MSTRSVNEIVDTWQRVIEIAGPLVARNCELCAMAGALMEAQEFLEDMTKHCHGKRAQRAVVMLKKWDARA
jgi:hypothetical protein